METNLIRNLDAKKFIFSKLELTLTYRECDLQEVQGVHCTLAKSSVIFKDLRKYYIQGGSKVGTQLFNF